jgi:hypothetical protein
MVSAHLSEDGDPGVDNRLAEPDADDREYYAPRRWSALRGSIAVESGGLIVTWRVLHESHLTPVEAEVLAGTSRTLARMLRGFEQ